MREALPAEPLRKLRVVVDGSGRATSVRFPVSFVREQLTGERPPLARLVRAGEVRLKLHLTLALMATRQPYELEEPPAAHWFADMLGLPNPDVNGARRVTEALTWLHNEEFIARSRRPGKPPHVKLLHHGSASGANTRYVQIPLDLWRQGWILRLSAKALGIYLVLKEATGGSKDNAAVLSGSRKDQYYLSDETWARAVKELESVGLLRAAEVFAKASSKDKYGPKRRRLRYTLINPNLVGIPGIAATVSGDTDA